MKKHVIILSDKFKINKLKMFKWNIKVNNKEEVSIFVRLTTMFVNVTKLLMFVKPCDIIFEM